MSAMISDTYFGIDFGCVLASILSPFCNPFGINVRVFGVLVFNVIFSMYFSHRFYNCSIQNRTPESPPWVHGLAAAPPKIAPRIFFHRLGAVLGVEGFSARCSVVFCNIIDRISV